MPELECSVNTLGDNCHRDCFLLYGIKDRVFFLKKYSGSECADCAIEALKLLTPDPNISL